MNLHDFIEYDNHNGVTLLKVCLMNTFHEVYFEDDVEIKLYHIPYSLIIECLEEIKYTFNLSLTFIWEDNIFEINSYINNEFIFKILGNVESGTTIITNRESTKLSE